MKPTRITLTEAGTSNPVPLDHRSNSWNTSVIFDILSGTPTFAMELTADDVFAAGYTPAAGNWQAETALGGTAGESIRIASPMTAIRFTQTGAGSVRMTVIHEGGGEN